VHRRIQQLFGIDAKDRFLLMCTFVDATTPKCLGTLAAQNVRYENYFKFNNSALYTYSEHADDTILSLWKMGMESVQQLEDYVVNRKSLPLSLTLSK
jgi:hypothetical protein